MRSAKVSCATFEIAVVPEDLDVTGANGGNDATARGANLCRMRIPNALSGRRSVVKDEKASSSESLEVSEFVREAGAAVVRVKSPGLQAWWPSAQAKQDLPDWPSRIQTTPLVDCSVRKRCSPLQKSATGPALVQKCGASEEPVGPLVR